MTSSGMKRGLAVVAVSALGVTGLPLLAGAANAVPLSAQTAGNPVVIQTGPTVSVHNDGVDTKAHLVATAQANVTSVEFSYVSGTAAPVSIAKVAASNGAFSTLWDVPSTIYNTNVTLRAEGFDKDGNSVGTPVTEVVAVSPSASAVNVANAAGSTVNVFQAPYTGHAGTFGAVSGTTSDAGDVTVNGGALQAVKYGDPANGIRTFSGIADFGSSYDFGTATDADQALIHAVVSGSDDNQPVVLNQQFIKNVTATAAKTDVPASNPTTRVTVTVKDANGNPIYGAQVIDEDAAKGTGYVPSYTDQNGQATFDATVPSGASSVTKAYTVNADNDPAYDSNVDNQKSVTIKTYADTAAGIVGVPSDLGSALDRSEYAAHQVKIQVNDTKGAPEANQTVNYSWTVVPFDSKATVPAVEKSTVKTGPDGTVAVPAPSSNVAGTYTLKAYQEVDGDPGQTDGDRSMTPISLKLGTGTVSFDDGSVAQGESGTSKSFDAKLELEDGTPLAGRTVNFTYNANGGNAALSKTQPGDTVTDTNGTHDKTDSNGVVSVSVADPNQPPAAGQHTPAEYGGVLSATPAGLTVGNLKVDWLRSLTPASATFGTQQDLVDDIATPGRPVSQSVTVKNADGDTLTDQTLTLNVDHGFFTPQADDAAHLTADPAAADGGQYGEWKSSGNSIQVTTDDNGVARYTTAIERDPGFDDDGAVSAVTSVAGIKDANNAIAWASGNKLSNVTPLNPGTVSVQLADQKDQTVDIVNAKHMAPTDEEVKYDVVATDQFGNRVQAPVTIADDSASKADYSFDGWSNFTNAGPVLTASSSDATTQKLTGKWEGAQTNTYGDTDANTAGVQLGRVTQSGDKGMTVSNTADALSWYVRDLDHGQYAVTHTGNAMQPVGNVVTQTYTAKDQNGEPVQGLQVVFFRSGPDNLQDGSGNAGGTTNDEGQVFYTYQGAKAGKAVTTAVVSSPDNFDGPFYSGWTRFTPGDASDTVTFARSFVPTLSLSNQKDGDDVAFANGPSFAKGVTVKLYRVDASGNHLVAQKRANSNGNAEFVVNDRSNRKSTKYVAHFLKSGSTFSAWTPKSSIK